MYEITQQYNFVATHQILGLPDAHPCARVHSHRWTLEVVIAMSVLLPTDGPSEFSGLEPLRRYVLAELGDKHLNDVVIGPPTPARLAGHVAGWSLNNLAGQLATSLSSVVVSTDASSRARYIVPRTMRTTR
jgi:6-pyruvoyltetrahydropterin/6-carboxytetrahydropterin synthase